MWPVPVVPAAGRRRRFIPASGWPNGGDRRPCERRRPQWRRRQGRSVRVAATAAANVGAAAAAAAAAADAWRQRVDRRFEEARRCSRRDRAVGEVSRAKGGQRRASRGLLGAASEHAEWRQGYGVGGHRLRVPPRRLASHAEPAWPTARRIRRGAWRRRRWQHRPRLRWRRRGDERGRDKRFRRQRRLGWDKRRHRPRWHRPWCRRQRSWPWRQLTGSWR
mmetsp:Transcript_11367/g.30409  ORF Transcript_11367/g.30409 Transcript_11367/m.30409 type:complete len:220 (-) Transcript_11367:962-1621(-)